MNKIKLFSVTVLVSVLLSIAQAAHHPPPPVPSVQCVPNVKYDIVHHGDGASDWTQRNLIEERFTVGGNLVCKYGAEFQNGLDIPYDGSSQ